MAQWDAAAVAFVISSIVAGLVTVIASISSAISASRARTVSEKTDLKADTIIEKAVEIHTLTNSNLSRVTAALEVANQKIQGLQELVASIAQREQAAVSTPKDVRPSLEPAKP